MLKIYTKANHKGCQIATEWFCNNSIPFIEKRIDKANCLKKKDIYQFLCLSPFGFDGLLAKRSKLYLKYFESINDMSTSEVVDILVQENTLLHLPILCDGKRIQFGTNVDGFRTFIPREEKKVVTMLYQRSLINSEDIGLL